MIVQVEKKRLDFLHYAFFGTEENPYIACSRKAYRDLCRTIRFNGKDGSETRERVDKLLNEEMLYIFLQKGLTCADYDAWHKDICLSIVKEYTDAGVEFSIGQAQKWVNMTAKYLNIFGNFNLDGVFEFLHVPLDRYVFELAKDEFKLDPPNWYWSRMTDYDVYIDYQNKLRSLIDGAPLHWEFESWLTKAKSNRGEFVSK